MEVALIAHNSIEGLCCAVGFLEFQTVHKLIGVRRREFSITFDSHHSVAVSKKIQACQEDDVILLVGIPPSGPVPDQVTYFDKYKPERVSDDVDCRFDQNVPELFVGALSGLVELHGGWDVTYPFHNIVAASKPDNPSFPLLSHLFSTFGPEYLAESYSEKGWHGVLDSSLFEVLKAKEKHAVDEALGIMDCYQVGGEVVVGVVYGEQLSPNTVFSTVLDKAEKLYGLGVLVVVRIFEGFVSVRSNSVDCSALSGGMGGGGHPKSSGFALPVSVTVNSLWTATLVQRMFLGKEVVLWQKHPQIP